MSGNTFGKIFQVTTFGESHGNAIGCVIDGCPAGIEITESEIQKELDRRKPGQSKITTQRKEGDQIKILSGISDGKTLGTPIALLVFNEDANSKDYDHLKDVFRPGQADYTYQLKYGIREHRGGGRGSARETLARVAAGSIAKKILKEKCGTEILAFTEQIEKVTAEVDLDKLTLQKIESNIVRCPDEKAAQEMIVAIEKARDEKDSVGGVVKCLIKCPPKGIGEPVFDRVPAELAKAMMSINATKGFDFGSGFAATQMRGSQHNDEFCMQGKEVNTKTNNAGGSLGGISTGGDMFFRVAFKPTSTIGKKQNTVTKDGQETELEAKGRHDPCIVPRAVPIVEAMAALTILDLWLRNK
ncbi:chorismate synthase [Candidatus Gracilibacteria bacterium]|nr:chorismate synthase [Candidatus Gracilibacteria bacterium]